MRRPRFLYGLVLLVRRYGLRLVLLGVAVGLVGWATLKSWSAPAPAPAAQTQAAANRFGGLGAEEAQRTRVLLDEQRQDAAVRKEFPAMARTLEQVNVRLGQTEEARKRETDELQGQLRDLRQQLAVAKAQPTAPPPRPAPPARPPVPPVAPTLPQVGPKLYLLKPSEVPGKALRTPRANHLQTAHIPWWSFAPARVVFGGMASSRERSAVPILLALTGEFTAPYQLQGPARNPLRTALEIQGCFAGGYAGGDLAASRVVVQLVALSCVFPSGESFEQPIDGYVVGRDGRYGIHAQVDHHASAAEAKAFLTALLQETSAALGLARSQVVVTSVSGGTQPFQGTQTMLTELGRFYLQQVAYLLPTLTAEPDSPAWVVLKEGVTLEGLPVTVQTNSVRGGNPW